MPWPWNRPAVTLPPAPPASIGDDRRLEPRVIALEDRLAHLVAETGLLRVEWAEVLDKISRWAARQSGREGKVAQQRIAALASEEPAGAANGAEVGMQGQPRDKAALRALLRRGRGINSMGGQG